MQRLYARRVDPSDLVGSELAREIYELAQASGRRVGVLISREGTVEEVFVGTREILYLPDLGRYRLGTSRLRRLRLIFSDLSKGETPHLPPDIMADLEKLRLDAVAGVKQTPSGIALEYAHLKGLGAGVVDSSSVPPTNRVAVPHLGRLKLDFLALMEQIESELSRGEAIIAVPPGKLPAALISVSDRPSGEVKASLEELEELARTADIYVVERVIQRKKPDPRSVLGKGKLEEVVLRCLRLGVEMIVFDTELKPSQWRTITNATELKVIDRSMLILDIFAQRAQSSEGRLQVELAQLKYNLPRLVEKDAGLSRLTGGIGGRGPGETKLEIGRRRTRERIADLEREIENFRKHRAVKRRPRQERGIPLVALVGYTNVGKSTIFNRLTGAGVLAENKLFATLDPFQRRVFLRDRLLDNTNLSEGLLASQPPAFDGGTAVQQEGEPWRQGGEEESFGDYSAKDTFHSPAAKDAGYSGIGGREVIFSDTVGFIRDLPAELMNAFRATLEELHSAELLVHVADASDPRVLDKVAAVRSILSTMELGDTRELTVLNKIDKAPPDTVTGLAESLNAVPVSALSGEGLNTLLEAVRDTIFLNASEPAWASGPPKANPQEPGAKR